VTDRAILHLDMDAFYASVEVRDNPDLRGKAVIVGGHPTRGVVLTCTYEARKFGVRSAMSMVEALQRAPHALVVPPRGEAYAAASRQVFDVMRSVTPLVEGLSLDEAFLDVTASRAIFGDARAIALHLKKRIREVTNGLTASVGVSACKFVAKVASDLGKPDGLTICPAGLEEAFLAPLPIERLWGVGPKTAELLHQAGYQTIGDIQRSPYEKLVDVMGAHGADHISRLAVGDDPREVEPGREAKSIGSESTFNHDLIGREPLREPILRHCEEVARRLRADGYRANALVLKVKRGDHSLITRRSVAEAPLIEAGEIYALALQLLERIPLERVRTRLVGVSATDLETIDPAQRELFPNDERLERPRAIAALLDAIDSKFGAHTIRRAGG
jgi:DNA polymerase IV